MGSLLRPTQLGYGTRHGAEAAVHAARICLSYLDEGQVMVKLDYSNAFNTIRRDRMLSAVLKSAPELYLLVYSAYSQSTNLFFGSHIIPSSEGVQQGDPLGPLLFCLTIYEMTSRLSSSFKVFYLDDGMLCRSVEEVLEDFRFLIDASSDLGLVLNTRKCEVIGNDENTA